jgi:ketose-bisphosphate aldolase
MPLVGPKNMLDRAYKEGYAIGAFNVNNMEIVQGIMQAGAEEKAPLILQVSAGARKYAGQPYIMKLVEAALQESDLPVVVHLDHGPDFELCKACIDGGFTSVMIDGSHLSYEENIAITKKVVDYAHDKGVWVEAELGKLAGVEEHVSSTHSVYTDPDQAVEFVQRSGCDSLAIAIGTSHGAYKFTGDAQLDFPTLRLVRDAVKQSQKFPIRKVKTQRRQGNIAPAEQIPVGSGIHGFRGNFALKPPIGVAARIFTLIVPVFPNRPGLRADLHALGARDGQIGIIHVHHAARRQALPVKTLYKPNGVAGLIPGIREPEILH